MKIDIIAGARPNFMKIAPIIEAIEDENNTLNYRLIHTGQHYDKNMSGSFFEQLDIPLPDINLEAGGGTSATQTAKIMVGYEQLLEKESADFCIVVGDVTSTMACTIVAKKQHMLVAHIEAGIRSGDLRMPEEVNRIVTDSLTDFFFTTSELAGENLIKSGVKENQIFFVGNTMIDTLIKNRSKLFPPLVWEEIELKEKGYIVMTLHRPSNVDEGENLKKLINEIVKNSRSIPIIFPVHPRTKKVLDKLGIKASNLYLIEPLSYLEFNYLVEKSKVVITDSGGITEETTVMGVPCITLRENTERPETISIGTNELVGVSPLAIPPVMDKLFNGKWKRGGIPPMWDGNTASRIVDVLIKVAKTVDNEVY